MHANVRTVSRSRCLRDLISCESDSGFVNNSETLPRYGVPMSELRDIEARRRALTDLDATLVVEAAAGTGKTSLLSGRVAMLLARGADPSEIAAITFTELAASELGARITEYMDRLLVNDVPECLELVVP